MQGLNKTKAALQGRQCQSTKLKPIQNTTLIDQVNRCDLYRIAGGVLTPPLPEFDRVCIYGATGIPVSVGYQALPYTLEYYENFVGQPFLHPFSKSSGLTEQSGFRSESNNPVWYKIHRMIIAMIIRPGRVLNSRIIVLSPIKNQPFGSMPRCCSSLRMMRLIQAASDSSPSCRCASSIESRSSGSSRNWNGGFPRLSFLCVDTFSTPDVVCLCVMTHYMHMNEKATPRSAVTLPRRLTKPLYEVTIMADMQSTQTRPEFTWRFLSRVCNTTDSRIIVVYTNASTEAEARANCPSWDLIFAARLPLHEFEVVRHA